MYATMYYFMLLQLQSIRHLILKHDNEPKHTARVIRTVFSDTKNKVILIFSVYSTLLVNNR